MKRMRIFWMPAAALVLALGSTASALEPSTTEQSMTLMEEKIWMVGKPMNCLSNPWEKDWLARNKKKAYPILEEREIIKAYFRRQAIPVSDLRIRPGFSPCKTCECPRGDSLYLHVNLSDSHRLKDEFGFERRLLPTSR